MSATGSGPPRPGHRPLAGVRVAVTRPAARAAGLTAPLEAAGATTRCFPLIRIVEPTDPAPLQRATADLRMYDWVVLTSATAVAVLARGAPLPRETPPRFAVVGPATAEALTGAGRRPDLVAGSSRAEGLVEDLLRAAPLAGLHVLWPRAAGARMVLSDALTAAGAVVVAPEAYASVADAAQGAALADALRAGEIDVVTFTSPSAVRSFAEAGGVVPDDVGVAAIGPVTAAAVEAAGHPVHVLPENASAALLAEAIEKTFGKRS